MQSLLSPANISAMNDRVINNSAHTVTNAAHSKNFALYKFDTIMEKQLLTPTVANNGILTVLPKSCVNLVKPRKNDKVVDMSQSSSGMAAR